MAHRTLEKLVSLASPLALTLVFAVACFGDTTSSEGLQGRLVYSLSTDYEGEQEELTALPLLTGYSNFISVGLTSQGRRDALGEAGSMIHTADGIDGIEIYSEVEDEDSIYAPDFEILAPVPGEATIRSMLRGEVFDQIKLRFESPTRLDVIGWTRAPWEEDWAPFAGEALAVPEGSQISFLVVPMYKSTRIGGKFTPNVAVDPPSLAVPDVDVVSVQESSLASVGEPLTFYALEPGFVTFTLSDPVNGVEAVKVVEVTPLTSL